MRVRVPNLFIIKLVAVDTFAAGTIVICEVTALSHEASNHSMEEIAFVGQICSLLARTQGSEVFRSFWNLLGE